MVAPARPACGRMAGACRPACLKRRKELEPRQSNGMAGSCEQASDIPLLVVRSTRSLAHSFSEAMHHNYCYEVKDLRPPSIAPLVVVILWRRSDFYILPVVLRSRRALIPRCAIS